MSLALCMADTRDAELAYRTISHSINVMQGCHKVTQVYWISDQPLPGTLPVPHMHVKIPTIHHIQAYNQVCLHMIPQLVQEDHVLIIQTDGYAHNAHAWSPEFLNYDYVGARWPYTWNLPHTVGNGGFSLRSKKLLQCLNKIRHPVIHTHEDFEICIHLRAQLEATGCRWAPEPLADQFSIENCMESEWLGKSLGFHGKHLKPIYAIPEP